MKNKKQKLQKGKKKKQISVQNFETLSDVADYRIKLYNSYTDLKILKRCNTCIGTNIYSYIFRELDSSNNNTALQNASIFSILTISSMIMQFVICGLRIIDQPFADQCNNSYSYALDPLRNSNIGVRLDGMVIYKLYDQFCNKFSTPLTSLIGFIRPSYIKQKQKNQIKKEVKENENKDIKEKRSWIEFGDYLLYSLLCRSTFGFHADVSLLGLVSINEVSLGNSVYSLSLDIMSYKVPESIFLWTMYYFGCSIGACLRVKVFNAFSINSLMDTIRLYRQLNKHVNIKAATTNNSNISVSQSVKGFPKLTYFLNYISVKDFNLILGSRFCVYLKPLSILNITAMNSSYSGIEVFKDPFFDFYYGFSFRWSKLLFEAKRGVGFLSISRAIIRYLVSSEDIEYTSHVPRICQGPVLFRNSLDTYSYHIYIVFDD